MLLLIRGLSYSVFFAVFLLFSCGIKVESDRLGDAVGIDSEVKTGELAKASDSPIAVPSDEENDMSYDELMPGGKKGKKTRQPIPPVTGDQNDNFSCFDFENDDFGSMGQYDIGESQQDFIKLYEPIDIDRACRMPIVNFSSGVGKSCDDYKPILEHLASHGFLVACNSSATGSMADRCIDTFENLLAAYAGRVLKKFGTIGHAEGGSEAISCAYFLKERWGSEVEVAVHGIQPSRNLDYPNWKQEYGQLVSPVFLMSDSLDMGNKEKLVREAYDALQATSYWYVALGAGSFNIEPLAKESSLAWFRMMLLEDQAARHRVDHLANDGRWLLKEKKLPR